MPRVSCASAGPFSGKWARVACFRRSTPRSSCRPIVPNSALPPSSWNEVGESCCSHSAKVGTGQASAQVRARLGICGARVTGVAPIERTSLGAAATLTNSPAESPIARALAFANARSRLRASGGKKYHG